MLTARFFSRILRHSQRVGKKRRVVPRSALRLEPLEDRVTPSILSLPSTNVPSFTGTFNGNSGPLAGGDFKGNLDGTSLTATYCVDIPDAIYLTTYNNATANFDGNVYGTSIPNAGAIAWLIQNLGPLATTPDQQSALQAAIWRTEYGNNFQLNGVDNNGGRLDENFVIAPMYTADLAALGNNTAPVGSVVWISPGTNPGPHPVSPHGQALVAVQASVPPPSWLHPVANDLTHSAEYYTKFITAAYQTYLGRSPDAGGLASWLSQMQNGLTDEQLEAAFIGSGEYIQNHGGPGAGWVTSLYHDLLGRTPSPSEVAGWVQALANGETPAQVAYGFAASSEREGDRVVQDYQTFLGRSPAPAEVAGWVNAFETHAATNEDVVAGFVASAEYFQNHHSNPTVWFTSAYQALFGQSASQAVPAPSSLTQLANDLTHSNEYYTGIITAAYQHYLGRAPDGAGLAAWLSQMQNGLTDEQLEASLLSSDEYIQNHGGLGGGWIVALYNDLLGRQPSPAEIDNWVRALNDGETPAQVALVFTTSSERESARVTQDYQNFLGRTPSPAEVSGWVNLFENHSQTNEDVVAGFVGSGEFYQNAGSSPAGWWEQAVTKLFQT
jgi:hypothetical protein